MEEEETCGLEFEDVGMWKGKKGGWGEDWMGVTIRV